MLLTGLQMLRLFWILLWMPELGLSSPLSLWDMPAVMAPKDMPNQCNRSLDQVPLEITEEESETKHELLGYKTTQVRMVHSNNSIYKQFRNTPYSMYMVFNKTELREAVPKHLVLYWAELHLYRRKQLKGQLVTLSEKYTNNTWSYVTRRFMAPSNKLDRLWFDVTEVVQRWLNQEDDIEVFRLRRPGFAYYNANVFPIDVIGITPSCQGDIPEDDSLNRPLLLLFNIPPETLKDVNNSWDP